MTNFGRSESAPTGVTSTFEKPLLLQPHFKEAVGEEQGQGAAACAGGRNHRDDLQVFRRAAVGGTLRWNKSAFT